MRNCPHCSQPASLQHLFLDCIGGHALEARLVAIGRDAQLWSQKPGEILRTLLFQKPTSPWIISNRRASWNNFGHPRDFLFFGC